MIKSYRDWYRAVSNLFPGRRRRPPAFNCSVTRGFQAPEIVNLYLLDLPTPAVRAKIRQEFERNRYVKQLPVVDVLITKSDIEFQETMNYWKQTAQLMKYFRSEENPATLAPKDFMTAFLEVWLCGGGNWEKVLMGLCVGTQLEDTAEIEKGSVYINSECGNRLRLFPCIFCPGPLKTPVHPQSAMITREKSTKCTQPPTFIPSVNCFMRGFPRSGTCQMRLSRW